MPGDMVEKCPVSCNYCHLVELSSRCSKQFLNITHPALDPGDIGRTLGSLRERYNTLYGLDGGGRLDLARRKVWTAWNDPPIIVLDGFLADIEVAEMLDWNHPWERSLEWSKRYTSLLPLAISAYVMCSLLADLLCSTLLFSALLCSVAHRCLREQ